MGYPKHPDRDHLNWIRQLRRQLQKGVDGQVHCGTCNVTEKEYPLELHHRHYDTWGKERVQDMVLLCKPCHEAITSVFRQRRFKKEGIRQIETPEILASSFRPNSRSPVQETKDESATVKETRFRPKSRRS